MITAISFLFIKLVIWALPFSVKLVNIEKSLVKKLLKSWIFFQRNFYISALLLRNQSICNLVTILSLYCRLQCTCFPSRMFNTYIDLIATYLLREWIIIITEGNRSFLCLYACFTKKHLHSFNLLCISSFNINIEYIHGTILQKSQFGVQAILNMVVSLNMKMVNPWLSDFPI